MAPRKPFLLRIDPALWAELEAWAQDELRSVNGQIEYLLKQAVNKRKRGAESNSGSQAASRRGVSCNVRVKRCHLDRVAARFALVLTLVETVKKGRDHLHEPS